MELFEALLAMLYLARAARDCEDPRVGAEGDVGHRVRVVAELAGGRARHAALLVTLEQLPGPAADRDIFDNRKYL